MSVKLREMNTHFLRLYRFSETSLSIVFLFSQNPDLFSPSSSGRQSGFSSLIEDGQPENPVRLAYGHMRMPLLDTNAHVRPAESRSTGGASS